MTTLLRLVLIASVAVVAFAANNGKMKAIVKKAAAIYSNYARTRDPNDLNEFNDFIFYYGKVETHGNCMKQGKSMEKQCIKAVDTKWELQVIPMFIQQNDVGNIVSHLNEGYTNSFNDNKNSFWDVWTMVQKNTQKTMYCSARFSFSDDNDPALKLLEFDCPICDFESIPVPGPAITSEEIMEIIDKNFKIYASQRDVARVTEIYDFFATRYYPSWQNEYPLGLRRLREVSTCFDQGGGRYDSQLTSLTNGGTGEENAIPNYIRSHNISSITSRQEGTTLFWTLTRNDTLKSINCTLHGDFRKDTPTSPRVSAFYFECPYCSWDQIQ